LMKVHWPAKNRRKPLWRGCGMGGSRFVQL